MTCRKCGNPIEQQPDGRWGTPVRMRWGCYHTPIRSTARPMPDDFAGSRGLASEDAPASPEPPNGRGPRAPFTGPFVSPLRSSVEAVTPPSAASTDQPTGT